MSQLLFFLPMMMLSGCARNDDPWANIDYTKIARENYRRENDTSYTPPNVLGCVDDDLYNCPTGSTRYRY